MQENQQAKRALYYANIKKYIIFISYHVDVGGESSVVFLQVVKVPDVGENLQQDLVANMFLG